MIVKEFFVTRNDGVNLYKTYSTDNFYIRQIETGVEYSESIDIEDAPYTYEETDRIIEIDEINLQEKINNQKERF